MQSKAILMAFHKYTPFGGEFYEPILDFQLKTLHKYKDEFDTLYLVDSNWNIDIEKIYDKVPNKTIVKVDPSLRYYDAYKKVLPQVKEDLVLLMDDDMVVYRPGLIQAAFNRIEEHGGKTFFDVVSIYDTIGTMKVDLPHGKNKFCPYWFGTRKDLLMKYLDVDWSPDAMPYTETFGLLTEAMLKDGLRPYEWPEDKGEVLEWDPIKTELNTGTYHVRAGSTCAYLLATKHYGDLKTYWDYLETQPKSEIIRHCKWYAWMGGDPKEILADL